MYPPGRIGTTKLLEITGLGRTTFFTRYRPDPRWISFLDMRVAPNGRLTFDEAAARELAILLAGRPAEPPT